jgi:uncharacterized protein (DUF58 family)
VAIPGLGFPRAGAKAGAGHSLHDIELAAHALAGRLPDLLMQAKRVAATVAHGIHGRRRAGPGETFWQFRHVQPGDPANMIDWRRSASSDHLYLREREWEAAHTVWMWGDLSPSMDFQSHLARLPKGDRALVLMFALTEMLIAGGERVGLLGLMPPTASRTAMERAAQIVLEAKAKPEARESLPPAATLRRFNGVILIGDFLDPIAAISQRVAELAASGVNGHIVQVLDPAEESLPYDGRVEFLGLEDGERLLANRSETLREGYRKRITAHKATLADLARRLEWGYLVHHTDRPPEETLLALHTRLSGLAGSYKIGGGFERTAGAGGGGP